MSLFSIHCTTCRARLKVRDAAAIGQILACPKCGSMVQVLPPEGWEPGDESSVSSSALSGSQASASQPSASPSSGELAGLGRWKDEIPSGGKTRGAARETEMAGVGREQAPGRFLAMPGSAAWLKWTLWAGLPTLAVCAALVSWLWSSRLPQAELAPLAAAAKIETPTADAEPKPPAKPEPDKPAAIKLDRRFVPAGAQGLVSLRLNDLSQRPAAVAVFRHLGAIWQRGVEPLCVGFNLPPEQIRRLTWVTTKAGQSPGERWLQAGVAVVELEPAASKNRPTLGDSDALDWKFAGAAVHPAPGDAWPHPFALVHPATIVTGPEALLRQLADRSDEHLENADFERLLDRLDFRRQAVAAVSLEALRKAKAMPEWLPLVDVWQVSKDDWRVVRDSPAALGLELGLGDSLEAELRLACESETAAEQVRESLDRLLEAMESTLAGEVDGLTKKLLAGQITTADASRLKQLLAAGREALGRRESGVEGSLVWARTPWQGDLPNLAVAALASVPDLEASRLAAARTLDEANQRQLLLGLSGYDKVEGALPFGAADASLLPPETRLSWIATLLPYYDRLDWHGELNFARSWNDAANGRVTRRPLDPVINPALGLSHTKAGFPVTHYVGLAGIGPDAGSLEVDDSRAGAFGFRRRISPAEFSDGASNTIALMGVQSRLGAWASGGDATVRPLTQKPYINGPDGFGSGQPEGMFVGMADGSVRFLSKDIDTSVLEAMATIRGGEKLPAADATQFASNKPKLEMPLKSPHETEAAPAAERPHRASAPGIDVTARLDDPLPGLQFENTPLDEALALLSQLSTVPIMIDAEALAQAGVSPAAKISLQLSDTTVGGALAAVVAERGLEYVVVDGQVLVTNPDRREQKLETVRLHVADLISGERSAEDLAKLVERFVEPTSWQSAGGSGTIKASDGKLSIEQTRTIADQTSEFLDKLRLAAGKSPSGKSASGPRSLATRYASAKSLLAAPVTANFRQPVALSQIADHLGKAVKAKIAFDGLALSGAGASPATPAQLTVAEQPLAETLKSLLEPLHLSYRIAGAKQLMISTPEAVGERLEVEFYPVATLIGEEQTADALIERIKSELAPRSWDDAGGPGLMEYEPAGYLIVLQTQPRQIELEQLLDAWRAAAKQKK
ncbi:MAG TPA: DUF1559 domain-containing protein [Pirellulales bacterium]|nr:DUF1559 domain-containing protein [Pirellulales bacterium]